MASNESKKEDNNIEINIPLEEKSQPTHQINIDTSNNENDIVNDNHNNNKVEIEISSNTNPTNSPLTKNIPEKLDNESDSTTIDNDDSSKNSQKLEMKRHSIDESKTKGIDEYGYEMENAKEVKNEEFDIISGKSLPNASSSDSMIDIPESGHEKIKGMGKGTQPTQPIKYLKPREKRKIGFVKQFFLSRVYVTATVSAFTIFMATIINGLILRKYVGKNSNEEGIASWRNQYTVFMFFYILLISPLVEEIVFRKILFGFIKRYSIFIAYLVSCFLYAIAHFGFSFYKMYEEIRYFPLYFIIGMILCYTYNYDEFLASSLLSNILYHLTKILLEYTYI